MKKTDTKRQNSIKNAQLCIDDKYYVPNRYDKDNVSVNYLLILPELDSIARDSTDLQESRVNLLDKLLFRLVYCWPTISIKTVQSRMSS